MLPSGVRQSMADCGCRFPANCCRTEANILKQTGQKDLIAHPARRAFLVHCCWLMWSAVFPIMCGRTLSLEC